MPIIFEGDLAHIASLHLKENDFVFVAGSLRSDLHHLNASKGQTPLQVTSSGPFKLNFQFLWLLEMWVYVISLR